MKTLLIDNPTALFWASFNSFELRLPGEAVINCTQQGANDEAVAHWAPKINRPETCTPEALRSELSEYGAWDDDELADDVANWRRIVWCAAHNIKEDDAPDCSWPVS